MILLIALIVIATLILAEAIYVALDGRGPQRPPVSHHEDAQFLPPGRR